MHQILPKLTNPLLPWMIFPLACALVVIGSKCWMISHYGSSTPIWDQWDAEGLFYEKYFNGTFRFGELIVPHNEHRILVTRLWSLLLVELGGYWDPMLEMVANTLLLGAVVALLVVASRPILEGASWVAFALFSVVIFSPPFDWENTLAGFNSQWYFMLWFSIAGLLAIIEATAFTLRWWIALLALLLSYFSMASGSASMAAAFSICAVQMVIGCRAGTRELLGLAIIAVVTVATVIYIPTLPYHVAIKAQSFEQFFRALMLIASWPVASHGIVWLVLCAILVHAPAWLTSIDLIRLRPALTDRRWLLVALTGWVALQAAEIAYGRAASSTESRYLDVFAIALLVNFACLLNLLSATRDLRLLHWFASGTIVLWLLLVLFGSAKNVFTRHIPELEHEREQARDQTQNLRAFLETGDIKTLENKAFLAIPYPNAQRLAMIVSQPVIRALLPPELVGEASAARAQQRGLARFTGRPIEALKTYALRWGVLLIPAGFTLFLVGLAMQLRRKPKTASS